LLAELADVISRSKAATRRRYEARNEMNDLRDQAKSDRTETACFPTDADVEGLRERAAERDGMAKAVVRSSCSSWCVQI
jgi:hypothetical protein